MDRDPLEERDILKILDALDDARIIKKIIQKLAAKSTVPQKENLDAPRH